MSVRGEKKEVRGQERFKYLGPLASHISLLTRNGLVENGHRSLDESVLAKEVE